MINHDRPSIQNRFFFGILRWNKSWDPQHLKEAPQAPRAVEISGGYLKLWGDNIKGYIYMIVNMYVYDCIDIVTYVCMYVCMYVWMDVWVYGCMYGCMDVWMYVYYGI